LGKRSGCSFPLSLAIGQVLGVSHLLAQRNHGKPTRRVYEHNPKHKDLREDYRQLASHKVTIDGVKYDLKNHPHEHQTRTLEGPKGPYQKKQVRILDEQGKPITDWVNEK
jgi:hypothetical protein